MLYATPGPLKVSFIFPLLPFPFLSFALLSDLEFELPHGLVSVWELFSLSTSTSTSLLYACPCVCLRSFSFPTHPRDLGFVTVRERWTRGFGTPGHECTSITNMVTKLVAVNVGHGTII